MNDVDIHGLILETSRRSYFLFSQTIAVMPGKVRGPFPSGVFKWKSPNSVGNRFIFSSYIIVNSLEKGSPHRVYVCRHVDL